MASVGEGKPAPLWRLVDVDSNILSGASSAFLDGEPYRSPHNAPSSSQSWRPENSGGHKSSPYLLPADQRDLYVVVALIEIVLCAACAVFVATEVFSADSPLSLSANLRTHSVAAFSVLLVEVLLQVVAVVAIWVRCITMFRILLFLEIAAIAASAYFLSWTIDLASGSWEHDLSDAYATNDNRTCPGLQSRECCGWDRCPSLNCPFANESTCHMILHGEMKDFSGKVISILSIVVAAGVSHVLFGARLALHLLEY